jgi:hypothetical protein
LHSAVRGWQDAAPQKALRLFDRAHFIHEHPGWTYRDYDAAAAGDILFDREYHAMIAPMAEKGTV